MIYPPCESRWRAVSRASKTENFPAAKGSRLNMAVMCASISWSGGLLQRVRRHSGRAKESMEAEVRPVPSCRLSVPLETWRQLGPSKNANHIFLATKQGLIFYTLYSTAVCIPVIGLVGGVRCNFTFFWMFVFNCFEIEFYTYWNR